jgi:small subunit ribosomal protein S20
MIISKKIKNKKHVLQNLRNRSINRRYTSTIKTVYKIFLNKLSTTDKTLMSTDIVSIVKTLYSILDKAVKKNVIHKNKAARKKQTINKLSLL